MPSGRTLGDLSPREWIILHDNSSDEPGGSLPPGTICDPGPCPGQGGRVGGAPGGPAGTSTSSGGFGVEIPVTDDFSLTIDPVGFVIGDARADEDERECDAQCRVDRLNARVSADFPELANPIVRATTVLNDTNIGGAAITNNFVYVDATIKSDMVLMSLIFHERLHVDDMLFNNEANAVQYMIGEQIRHHGHDPYIETAQQQYIAYLSDIEIFGQSDVSIDDLVTKAPWRSDG